MKKDLFKIDPISLFSHELKTPLSSLKIGLSLLEKDFNTHKNILPMIKDEVDQMIDFIIDNLDLRYIQKKKDLLEFEWNTFQPLIKKACSSFHWIAKKENISLRVHHPKTEDFEIFIDPSWILCLLNNLLSNAFKFSPKNGEISIKYSFQPNSFVFSIDNKDQGNLDPAKAFDPFYKVDTSSPLKNTGLGLSIAKAIVEAHSGKISVDSQSGKIIFRFVLSKVRTLKQVS